MNLFSFSPRIVHPLFPKLVATPAARAGEWSTAIAGTFTELAHAAARAIRVRRAVYVLLREDEWLNDGQREALWQRYQVPVLALRVDRDKQVVAWECEAQNGLHHRDASEDTTCVCGRSGTRIAVAKSLAYAAD
jgi:hypothetical protein